MKNEALVLAYSGGLDTSYSLRKLSKEGYDVHGGERHGKINREKRKRRDQPESEQVKGTVFLYTSVDRADLVFKTVFNFLLKKPACNDHCQGGTNR